MGALTLVNPRKRRKTTRGRKRTTSVTRSVTRRYRRNPSSRGLGGAVNTLKDGAIGAVGAVATEMLLSKIPQTATMDGNTKTAVSALASIGLGMAVAKFGKKHALGKTMAQGGVTVALHSVFKNMVPGATVGAYYGDDFNDMGYTEPTQVWDGVDGYFEDNEEY